MNKNNLEGVAIMAFLIGYPMLTDGVVAGLLEFSAWYFSVVCILLFAWIIYRFTMGTWSFERLLRNAKKLRTPEEAAKFSSERERYFGLKMMMIIGAVAFVVGLVLKIMNLG